MAKNSAMLIYVQIYFCKSNIHSCHSLQHTPPAGAGVLVSFSRDTGVRGRFSMIIPSIQNAFKDPSLDVVPSRSFTRLKIYICRPLSWSANQRTILRQQDLSDAGRVKNLTAEEDPQQVRELFGRFGRSKNQGIQDVENLLLISRLI